MWSYNYTDELCHYGILGMKWGVRRYQNKDGTLTKAGQRRKKILNDAADKAQEHVDHNLKEAERLLKRANSVRYKVPTEKEIQRYLVENFGNDLKTRAGREAIKKDFGITDLNKWARDELAGETEYTRLKSVSEKYKEMAEYYLKRKESYMNADVSSISEKDVRKANKFIKSYFDTLYDNTNIEWEKEYLDERYGKI